MILADKITELRKRNGWSQEELAEKLDVSRQSISKWEGAQSTPDMNRLLKMSELFGVSTDYLLKDSIDTITEEEISVREEHRARPVSMEEAVTFLSHRARTAEKVSVGVMMCILSPALLFASAALQEAGIIPLSEAAVDGMGLIVLIALVGGAVALFLTAGLAGQRFEYMEKEEIDTEYGVDGMVRERREKYRQAWTMQLVTGIVLCVVSVIPFGVSLLVFGENELAEEMAVVILLVVVAAGVFMIVRASMVWGGFQVLLQEGDYTPEHKLEEKKNEHIARIYWGLTVAIYLAVSFLTSAWDKTWIVWPVAGVAYGVVIALARVLRKK